MKKWVLIFFVIGNMYAQIRPEITKVNPLSGFPGTDIEIQGRNFSTNVGSNIVWFGGIRGVVKTADSSKLTTVVPIGAMYTPVTVTVNALSSSSAWSFSPLTQSQYSINGTTFGQQKDFPITSTPTSVALADMNGDHRLDVITSNYGGGTVHVYRNNGIGGDISLANPAVLATPSSPHHVITADVDGDGKLDLVVVNRANGILSIFRNTSANDSLGTLSFASRIDFTTSSLPMYVASGDLDRDGKIDLVVANSGTGTLSLFKNNSVPGTVGFISKGTVAIGGDPAYVVIKDVNVDGRPDIVATTLSANSIVVLWNVGVINALEVTSFTSKVEIATAVGPVGIVVQDLNGDGKPDMIVSNHTGSIISVYQNKASKTDTMVASAWVLKNYPAALNPWDAVVTDLNGDGKLDFASTNWNSGSVSVYENATIGDSVIFKSRIEWATGGAPRGLLFGDINGDTRMDMVTTSWSGNKLSILKNMEGGEIIHPPLNVSVRKQDSSLILSWKHNDTQKVIRYRIYMGIGASDLKRGDSIDFAVLDTFKVFKDLVSGYRYYFAMTGIDSTGNESDLSPIVSEYYDVEPPSIPKGLHVLDSTFQNVVLGWNKNPETDVMKYRLYLDTVSNALRVIDSTVDRLDTIRIITGLVKGKRYFVRVTAVDFGGNESGFSNSVAVKTTNSLPPILRTAIIKANAIELKWTKSITPNVKRYFAYGGLHKDSLKRLDSIVILAKDTVANIFKLVSENRYYFAVSTVDSEDVESKLSNILSVYFDITPPSPPNGLMIMDSTNRSVLLKWSKGNENDVVKYRIYYDTLSSPANKYDSSIGGRYDTIKNVTGLQTKIRYYFRVSAVDSSGNEGVFSNTVQCVVGEIVRPEITSVTPPSGLIGSEVLIKGHNFSLKPGGNVVWFGGVQGEIKNVDSGKIIVKVPTGALYAPLTVTANNATCRSAEPFNPLTEGKYNVTASLFGQQKDYPIASTPTSVALADLDGDRRLDIVTSNYGGGTVYIYRNIGIGNEISLANPIMLVTPVAPHHVIAEDIDGDGKLDLVIVNRANGVLSVFRNTTASDTAGMISFGTRIDFATAALPMFVATGDMDGDGKLDIVVANSGTGTLSLYKNASVPGLVNLIPKGQITIGGDPAYVVVKDVNVDGRPEIIASTLTGNAISVLWNIGLPGGLSVASFGVKVDVATAIGPVGLVIKDLNGDGKPDMIVSNHHGSSISVYRNMASKIDTMVNSAWTVKSFEAGLNPWDAVISDVTGDGKVDFATTNWNGGGISVFENISTVDSINYKAKVNWQTGGAPRGLLFGDINGDTRMDIITTSWEGNKLSILKNMGAVVDGVRELSNTIPNDFEVSQNYPNPFNPTTMIRFGIPCRSIVSIIFYDALGRKVANIGPTEYTAGYFSYTLNASRWSSGMYFYRLHAVPASGGNAYQSRVSKLLLIK